MTIASARRVALHCIECTPWVTWPEQPGDAIVSRAERLMIVRAGRIVVMAMAMTAPSIWTARPRLSASGRCTEAPCASTCCGWMPKTAGCDSCRSPRTRQWPRMPTASTSRMRPASACSARAYLSAWRRPSLSKRRGSGMSKRRSPPIVRFGAAASRVLHSIPFSNGARRRGPHPLCCTVTPATSRCAPCSGRTRHASSWRTARSMRRSTFAGGRRRSDSSLQMAAVHRQPRACHPDCRAMRSCSSRRAPCDATARLEACAATSGRDVASWLCCIANRRDGAAALECTGASGTASTSDP